MFCCDNSDLATCTFYYAGTDGKTGVAELCKMDMSGTTTLIIDKSHPDYVLSGPSPLFSLSGVVCVALSFTTQVTPGDMMAYLFASSSSNSSKASYHWFNNMLNYDVTYCFAPAFPNLHLLSSLDAPPLVAFVIRVGATASLVVQERTAARAVRSAARNLDWCSA